MSDQLEAAKAALNDIEETMKNYPQILEAVLEANPVLEPLLRPNWSVTDEHYLVFGAPELSEFIDIQQWITSSRPLSKMALNPASKIIRRWKKRLETDDAYYGDFLDFKFNKPLKGESLLAFLHRLAEIIRIKGSLDQLGQRALKSFFFYLREAGMEEILMLEYLFPEDGRAYTSRAFSEKAFCLPREITKDILQELSYMFYFGRPNAQLSAAESLGLCWVCLTASRVFVGSRVKDLAAIKSEALNFDGEFPTLQIPTSSGEIPVRISLRLAKFLLSLSQIPSSKPRDTIFQSPLRSLRRTFSTAVKAVSPRPDFENITFSRFGNMASFFHNHRHRSK